MVVRSRVYELFDERSFEEQALDNKGKSSENNPVDEDVDDLVIEKEKKPKKPKKTKTVNEIHNEIKKLVEQNQESKARAVLQKALQDGRKGKRLDKWEDKLMGSRSRDLFHRSPIEDKKKF